MRLLLILSSIITITSYAQSSFEKGIDFYRKRAENADNLTADPKNIDSAIYYFSKALIEDNLNEEKNASYLIRSYYYKGAFTRLNNEERKVLYNNGKVLGEEMLIKYPESAAIITWYMTCLGKWAETYGKINAAREGVVDKLKGYCEKLIKIDPLYGNGSGYRIFGAIHYEAPYIPFFLTWPSNNEAVKLLTKAYAISKEEPSNNYYLAQALYKDNQKEEAIQMLRQIVTTAPRQSELIEDKYYIQEAKKLLEEYL